MNPEDQNINAPQPTQPQPDILQTGVSTEQNPVAPTSTPTPPPMAEVPKPKSKLISTLVVILVFVALGALGYWAYQNYFVGQAVPTPSITPTPLPTLDPTANWKTYTNVKLGVSFKTPDDIQSVVSDYATFGTMAKNAQPSTFVSGTTHYKTDMQVCDVLPVTKDCFVESSSWGQTEKIKTTTLGGKAAISYFVNDAVIGEPVHVVETNFSPIVQIAQTVGGVGLDEVFDQILSTFKFLEATPSATPM